MKDKLKSIEQQLTYALEELSSKRICRDIMHDWISDSLRLTKEMIDPSTVIKECSLIHYCKLPITECTDKCESYIPKPDEKTRTLHPPANNLTIRE